jgi:hypothetical protein
MTFFVNSVVTGGAIDIAQVTGPWTEGGVTSLSRPTYLSPFLLGVPTAVSRQYVTVDVTQVVRDWVSELREIMDCRFRLRPARPVRRL